MDVVYLLFGLGSLAACGGLIGLFHLLHKGL